VTQTDDMSIEEAVQNIVEAVKDFENQTPEMQAKLHGVLKEMSDLIAQAETRQKELDQATAAKRRETAAERKRLRDELIPQWCEENLKPGMVVKVKANSHRKLRVIESVAPGKVVTDRYKMDGTLTGRHCHYDSRGELRQDGYITDHVLRNVQGVVLRVDRRGKPVIVPIMELIEGINENEFDSNKS